MKLILKICVLLLCLPVVAAASSEGESIYMKGVDLQGRTINTMLNDMASDVPLGCVNCHRESGFGSSESGQTFPPVSWFFLGKNQPEDNSSRFYHIQNKRPAYTAETLHRVLTTGISSKGVPVDSLMPRYALTRAQSDQILEYLKTLYKNQDKGVDDSVLHIATIIDSRLPEQQKQQHVDFLRGLIKMKNGLTRGEIRRKNFSPIQKAPQYESYRKWELEVWELPEDKNQWQKFIAKAYQQVPVFVVIRPLLKDGYNEIAGFCNQQKVPCLFPSADDLGEGDFYTFVFRNRGKQLRDYIRNIRREHGDRVLYVNDNGGISKLAETATDIPDINSMNQLNFEQDYNRYCGDDYILLAKSGALQAQSLEHLSCPSTAKISIKLIANLNTNFSSIANYLRDNKQSRLCWVSDYDYVLKRNFRQIRVDAMVRRFDIKDPDMESLAQTLFAFGLVTDSLNQMAGYFSRLYMMEIIEHMLNSFPNYTYFSTVTGAPYQRYIVGPIKEFCSPGAKI